VGVRAQHHRGESGEKRGFIVVSLSKKDGAMDKKGEPLRGEDGVFRKVRRGGGERSGATTLKESNDNKLC